MQKNIHLNGAALRRVASAAAAALAIGGSVPASAQADANATANAGDAFGYQEGDDAVGIYDASSVRGFDLQAAGNYRFDGTYFVKNSGLSGIFVQGNSVQIGYSALSIVLPGPSGVVDYRLRDPAPGERSVATLDLDPYGGRYGEVAYRHGSADRRSSFTFGVAATDNMSDLQGGSGGRDFLFAGLARLTRGPVVARIFGNDYWYHGRGLYTVTPVGGSLPVPIPGERYIGPDWAWQSGRKSVIGLVADLAASRSWGVGMTASYGRSALHAGAAGILWPESSEGHASYVQVVLPRQPSQSWSGELRGHREWLGTTSSQRIDVVLRGRRSDARFGGGADLALGDPFAPHVGGGWDAAPTDVPTASLSTAVRQWGVGVAYRATLGPIRINLGALRSDYRKSFVAASGVLTSSRSTPLQWNAGGAVRLFTGVEAYASYVHGFEEAGVAPSNAANRNEVLSAVDVTQREFGFRILPGAGFNVVLGAFDTRKPYAGIDPASRSFRFLGEVRHRGFEVSVSGSPAPGLSVVAGGVLLDPILKGVLVSGGLVGGRPVGVPRLRTVASVDYGPSSAGGVSIDASYEYVGRRAASSAPGASGQLTVPAQSTLNLGARLPVHLGPLDAVVRIQLLNVFGNGSWDVVGPDALRQVEPRRLRVVITDRF
jgi:iron complex outermembrane receptor protein